MKKSKKLIASALAIAISAVCTMPLGSSAIDNPFGKDPNGDGKLNISDYVCIIQYLSGYCNYTDIQQLDINGNGIVSEVDSIVLNNYLWGSKS